MISIDQKKIAGFEPLWAQFPGFSLLFDNHGYEYSNHAAIRPLVVEAAADGFYSAMSGALEVIGGDILLPRFSFCRLPFSSYHVTVWDGVNAENVGGVSCSFRSIWQDNLSNCPGSLSNSSTMDWVGNAVVALSEACEISFAFDRLCIWGNHVMAVRLRAADERSEKSLRRLETLRFELGQQAERVWGISTYQPYEPHVTLGYFANSLGGAHAADHLNEWNDRFQMAMTNQMLGFRSVGIYGFTDMAHFFRIG